RRARLDLLAQAMKALANLVRLENRHCLVESARLQVKKQRDRDRLQIANAVWSRHGRTCEHARGPSLPTQPFCKHRREFLQLVDILGIADQRERQLTCLLKIVIVDFQTLDRWKFAWQNIEDLRIQSQ